MRRPSLTASLALAALASGLAPSSARTQEQEALAVLERAAQRFRATSSFCASFHQELSIPLLDERREGHGRLCQRQPNLFMMRFDEPEGDRVVADGTYLWVYLPSSDPGQALRTDMSTSPGAFDFHREFLEDPASKYDARLDGVGEVAGRASHKVVLRPLRAASYQEAVVWIDRERNLINRVELREENGSLRVVTLTGIRLEAATDDALFRFTLPEGVRVISR